MDLLTNVKPINVSKILKTIGDLPIVQITVLCIVIVLSSPLNVKKNGLVMKLPYSLTKCLCSIPMVT